MKADDAKRLEELEGENARLAPTPRTGERVCRQFLLCWGGHPRRGRTGIPARQKRLATVWGSMPYLAATAASETPVA